VDVAVALSIPPSPPPYFYHLLFDRPGPTAPRAPSQLRIPSFLFLPHHAWLAADPAEPTRSTSPSATA
jgi:hypothetical protein